MKKALITGISGQDGSYLAPLLLDKGYDVHAILRRTSKDPRFDIDKFCSGRNITYHDGDIRDLNRVSSIMTDVVPDEIYNLAAQSHVGTSFSCVDETWDINYYGVGRIVNTALLVNPNVRIYQASTSEMFGNSPAPQNEKTIFDPQSPYAQAKLRAHQDFIVNKRKSQNAFTVSGILFNHESPRRGLQFVTRKITYGLARIVSGLQTHIELGNLEAIRDWGFAGDYVEAMHLMLQQDSPEDFVIASGESHSVRDFVETAAKHLDIEIDWKESGVDEIGINKKNGEVIIKINPDFYRPKEVNYLLGNADNAKKILGWHPKTSFQELVKMMSMSDLDLVTGNKR